MSLRLERIILMSEEFNRIPHRTRQEICEKFEIAERTFFDDLNFIRNFLGLEIKQNRITGRYYNADPSKKLPVFELSEGEVFALALGKEMLSEYVGTSFEPILRSAIEKIMRRLPHRVQMDVDDIKCMVKFDPGAVIKVEKQKFFDINKACETNRAVEITYYSAAKDEITTRVVDPYRLLQNRGTWYVVAWCRLRNDMRLFALHRIENHHVLEGVSFHVRDDFDVDAWIDKAFLLEHTGTEHGVKIHFKPRSARYIRERNWHPTQKLTEHEDKSCTLEFTTQSLDETKRWVLTYGSEAHVLEPPELREMLREEHRRAAQGYDRDLDSGS